MPRLSAPDRRETLLAATAEVMLEKGFARATTRDVATKLGIGRGLIHHYFETWDDLQRAAFQTIAQAAQADAMAIIAPLEGRAALARLLDLIIADPADAHWRLFVDAWDEAQTDPALAQIQIKIGHWWRNLLSEKLAPLIGDGDSRHDASWRLMALADGLSGHVLLPTGGLSRAEALRLLNGALESELARTASAR
jgi:AcrR family transcriptional regulator